jgi:16S rRNA (cytosine967-C5)-methyltransferase
MHPPVPLWRQLQAAASVLASVRRGESATPAIARLAADVRPGAQALAYHALRFLGRAEALRRLLAKKPPPPAADALLTTALALAWQEEGAPYEPFTLVDQAVEAAKRGKDTRPQQGFVNACLRRFLRERDALVAATDHDPVARWNHPRWWIALLERDHPQDW